MQNVTNGIGITIGTGIGGSLLINGDIYRGSNGAAGEVGYWAWSLPDERYNQQTFGEFESRIRPRYRPQGTRASAKEPQAGKTLRELVQMSWKQSPPRRFLLQPRQVTKTVCSLLKKPEVLGLVLANLSTVLDVQRIVIGGGGQAGEILLNLFAPPLRKSRPIPPKWSNLVWDIVLPLLVPPPDFCIAKDKVTMFP